MKKKIKAKNLKRKISLGTLLLIGVLLLHIFFRFYQLESRNQFTWDQVDNAWVAKGMIVDHKFPLVGMQAKQNTGFFIGSFYYYFMFPFYWIFNLDPVASGFIAGVTSIFSFFVLFYITRKVFSFPVAFIAVIIHTVSIYAIEFDRIQWPVNFVAPVSFIVFYCLYNVLLGRHRYLLFLSLFVGFAFHFHFTAVVYPIIILLALPFFPRTKKTFIYALFSLPLFFAWFLPHIISELGSKHTQSKSLFAYVDHYYHGFHLTRMLQVATDAFIEFEGILTQFLWKPIKYVFLPVFSFLLLYPKIERKNTLLVYLFFLWFVVTWVVFAVYKGEISNYYFSLTRFFAIAIIAYILWRTYSLRNNLGKAVVVLILLFYSVINIGTFFTKGYQGLSFYREKVKQAIQENKVIEFTQGDPQSYLYYIYTRQ